MAKRKYTKKSPYWDKFKKPAELTPQIVSQANFLPDSVGQPYYESEARSATSMDITNPTRRNRAAFGAAIRKYKNIDDGLLPYQQTPDGITVRDAIFLCQKAYANIGIFKNTIDAMSELADSELYFEKDSGSVKSRKFFQSWFKNLNLKSLKKQFLREFYRGGNIFLYRLDSRVTDNFLELTSEYQIAPTANIPVKYILLNPMSISAKDTSDFTTPTYEKILSKYELAVLKNPKTDVDRAIFDSLPKETKQLLKKNTTLPLDTGVQIPIDPNKLHTIFYKKQDYEPFATPFGFPVLEDLNTKLEFKKVDRAICRTIENVVLLMTMGAEPDKGGVNPMALQRMQELFKNESVGRVLVSDYTTKGEFLIPDLKKVIYKEKYDILNKDIQEALQNILISDEKFSNIQIKIDVFVERLAEGREAFLDEFLQPEIERVGRELGFRSVPKVRFKEIDIKDNEEVMRVATRLVELGILVPEQAMDLFNQGVFPKAEDLEESQKKYRQERKKGYYNPLVGGTPMGPEADKERDKPETSPLGGPNANQQKQNPKAAGRPNKEVQRSSAEYKNEAVQEVVRVTSDLFDVIECELKNRSGAESLSEDQMGLVSNLAEAIVTSTPLEDWESQAISCVKDFNKIQSLDLIPEINSIAQELDLDFYSAALLYHSKDGPETQDEV